MAFSSFIFSIKQIIDFSTRITKEFAEPRCSTRLVEDESLALDLLPSLRDRKKLKFGTELGLREPLQKLGGGDLEPVAVMGTRIARALAKVGRSRMKEGQ